MEPNIVVFLLDAARIDRLSCYGADNKTTPFLNKLIQNADKYNRAYSGSIWSLPSYATLFTGEYPSEHGAVSWDESISKNRLVSEMNAAGYETIAVSPHVVTGEFGIADEFDNVVNPLRSRRVRWEKDPAVQETIGKIRGGAWGSRPQSIAGVLRLMEEHNSLAPIPYGMWYFIEKVKRKAGLWGDDGANVVLSELETEMSKASKPFFAFSNIIEPHAPYRPPKNYWKQYVPDNASISELNEVVDIDPIDLILENKELTERQKHLLSCLYDAEMRYVDDKIKELYDILEDQGIRENTMVLILADHGDLFGEQNLWGHQAYIHNRLSHIPLIVDPPWESNKEVKEVTEMKNIYDYLSNIISNEENVEGSTIKSSDHAIVEYYGWDTQLLFDPSSRIATEDQQIWMHYQAAAISHEWKYFTSAEGDEHLFKIDIDPEENNNILTQHENLAKEMRQFVIEEVGVPARNHDEYRNKVGESAIDSSLEEHLKNLGYA